MSKSQSWLMSHDMFPITHDTQVKFLTYLVKLYHHIKFELNWFSTLEVTAKSWLMTPESWKVTHDSWRPCQLVHWVKLYYQKKFNSIASVVQKLQVSHYSWLLSHDKSPMTHDDHVNLSIESCCTTKKKFRSIASMV